MSALPRDFLTATAHEYKLSSRQEEVFVALYNRSELNIDKAAETLHISSARFRNRMTGVYTKFSIGKGEKSYILLNLLRDKYQNGSLTNRTTEPEIAQVEPLEENCITALVQAVRQRCWETIQREHSKIRLLNKRLIDVSDLYVDVYVLRNLSSERYADPRRSPPAYDSQSDRLLMEERLHEDPEDGLETARNYDRLMILGKLGSGKSTFLKHLAIACSTGIFCEEFTPVLITPRDVDASQFQLIDSIYDFQPIDLIRKLLGLSDVVQTQQFLQHAQVLVLLDGLDEVPAKYQRAVQDGIRDFSREYARNRYIFTCRTQTTEHIPDGFECVEVADLDAKKVEQFSNRWFAAIAGEKQGAALSEAFLAKLKSPEHERTARLAVTPLLLSLVCLIYRDLEDFPTKRSDLYKRGVDLLLKEWDNKQGVQRTTNYLAFERLSPTAKQNLLSHLALRKFEQPDSDRFTLFEQDEICRDIADYLNISLEDSEAVLKSIESHHGLLVERAEGIYSFSHLTFQEYFAAREIVESRNPEMLRQTVSYIAEPRWREVFLLTVGMMRNADEWVLMMKEAIDRLLTGEEYGELQQFLDWVQQKSGSVNLPYQPAVVRAFYFAYDHDRNRALGIDLDLDRALNRTLNLACTFDLVLFFNLDRAIDHDLDLALNHALDPGLQQKLQELREQLPDGSLENREKFVQWWQVNDESWTAQFRTILIEHRNIGHDWHFTDLQKQRLQEYLNTNQLLFDCLKSDYCVSHKVRQEIEETLLLPMSEVEKRRSSPML